MCCPFDMLASLEADALLMQYVYRYMAFRHDCHDIIPCDSVGLNCALVEGGPEVGKM